MIHTIESHTEGMPTRVVVGGVGQLPGATMAERRQWVIEHDDLRTFLMYEPRGHSAMSGAILQPPARADADWGVVYIEVTGCLPMCGHGTIGVATVLVEAGMVPVTHPVTTIRLDTPAGLVSAAVEVDAGGAARSVTIANVPAYCDRLDAAVNISGFGEVRYDMAFGGNFYAMVDLDRFGLPFDRSATGHMTEIATAILAEINEHDRPVHVVDPKINGCKHVQFIAPGSNAAHSRNAMAIYPGWFDRSPCGTGTCARMAQLHARGELAIGDEFVNESLIGSRFVGRLTAETAVGDLVGVSPTITGRAWLTGSAQYFLDPDDPFPAGFLF